MIFIIFLAVILILAFFITPIMIATNMVTLKKMQKVIDEYNKNDTEMYMESNAAGREMLKKITKQKLIDLKKTISTMDRKSFEHAKDLVDSI